MTKGDAKSLTTLKDVDALVTGSSRGLGFGIARAFANEGARVWMIAEMESELEEAADEIRAAGGSVEARRVDLAQDADRAALAEELSAEAPDLRVVVNNAGVLERRTVSEIDGAHWDRTFTVNLKAPVFLTRDLLPLLMPEGGSVINVSSRAGALAFKTQTAYCASKFGIEAFTRCLALELAGTRVSVNTVTPGLRIKPTSITRLAAASAGESTRAEWADPIELAPAFCFLAGLRGQVSGFRFDARTLTRALESTDVAETLDRIGNVAEHVPPERTGSECLCWPPKTACERR
jgi:gluconate 5-dehydrogenase